MKQYFHEFQNCIIDAANLGIRYIDILIQIEIFVKTFFEIVER